MIPCGKIVIASRADRGVRPYKTFLVFAGGACNFVIASCRVDVGIDPYGRITMLPFVARFCRCTVRGRGKPRPYATTKRGAAQKQEPFPSSFGFADSFPPGEKPWDGV